MAKKRIGILTGGGDVPGAEKNFVKGEWDVWSFSN